MRIFLTFLFLSFSLISISQVGIGISIPNPSAQLDVTSTTRGFLIPRMTEVQRDAIVSPATGLMIYPTDNTPGYYSYNGTAGATFASLAWSFPNDIVVNGLPVGRGKASVSGNCGLG